MPMGASSELVEALLYESESPSLDFKRDQYPFSRATDDQKSELLKDILAFANAWRRTDAHILIGVEEVEGGPSTVVGVSCHLSDSKLQQFVNSKTNRPIEFSYEVVHYEGVQLGVITIPVQERPFFLRKGYATLGSNVVYVRRGSATDVARPDEIARMGTPYGFAQGSPRCEVEFADVNAFRKLGDALRLKSTVVQLPGDSDIPDAPAGSLVLPSNTAYYRQYADYIRQSGLLRPFGFHAANTGAALLGNARVDFTVPKLRGLVVRDRNPTEPAYNWLSRRDLEGLGPEVPSVRDYGDKWRVSFPMGSVQPKAGAWSGRAYVGAAKPCAFEGVAVLYADNLSEPHRRTLSISIDTEGRVLTLDDLTQIADGRR